MISACSNAFTDLTLLFIRDLQTEFNSNWLIILQPNATSGKSQIKSSVIFFLENFYKKKKKTASFYLFIHGFFSFCFFVFIDASVKHQILKSRKTFLTYVSVFTSEEILRLNHELLFAVAPIILFRDLNNDLDSQLRIFNQFSAYYRFIWVAITDENLLEKLASVNIPLTANLSSAENFSIRNPLNCLRFIKLRGSQKFFSINTGNGV